MRRLLLRADVVSPVGGEAGDQSGCACRVSVRGARRCILPGSDVIELYEIHLARLSSLQVPVGHIAVPGGIKLCSPGTFLIANSLIINSGSCQVNFTKLNSATIRYTNSQWLREDATEAPVEGVALPKTVQKPPLPREDATEASVGRVAVPKCR